MLRTCVVIDRTVIINKVMDYNVAQLNIKYVNVGQTHTRFIVTSAVDASIPLKLRIISYHNLYNYTSVENEIVNMDSTHRITEFFFLLFHRPVF
jgi:hypothetical protein